MVCPLLSLSPVVFRDYLNRYAGQCIGHNGINLIVKRLSNRIIDEGYITTRVGIPEQDLSHGEFKLVLVPGVIRAIRIADPNQPGNWKTAFPVLLISVQN